MAAMANSAISPMWFEDTYRAIPVSIPPKSECFVAYTQTYSRAGSFIIPALPSQIPPPL
jgi:hypothetical protein